MKSLFKKNALLITGLLISSYSNAQTSTIDLAGPANEIGNQIKTITPIVLGIGFIIGCFANMKHFYGENADVKKGIINIVLFAIVIGVIYGLIRWVFSQAI